MWPTDCPCDAVPDFRAICCFPWNSSYISVWVSLLLPIVVGNVQILLLPGCNMSYSLQANIWQLCMDLATSRSLCLDLHLGLKKTQITTPPTFIYQTFIRYLLCIWLWASFEDRTKQEKLVGHFAWEAMDMWTWALLCRVASIFAWSHET